MGFFNKMKEPVFLKDSSDLCEQLERLRALELELDENGQEKIQQDMKYLEYGIQGENTIAYELKTVICRCIFYMIFILKTVN